MIDNVFRRQLPKYTRGLIKAYEVLRLSPNQITILGLIAAIVSAIFVARGNFLVAIAIWWFGRLLDGTDGIYARATNRTSSYGAFLDILCDMAAYSLMIIGFALRFARYDTRWMAILFLYVLCITGALALGGLENESKLPSNDNRGLRLAAGLAEGGETGIAYTLFLLFPHELSVLIFAWIAVLLTTVFARSYLAFQELQRQN